MSDPAPFTYDTPLTVAIDFKSPHAYLALRPTVALIADLEVPTRWLPLEVAPLARPTRAAADDDRGTRHRRFRAEYVARDLHRYAAVQGLALGDLYRNPDTGAANAGLLWVQRTAGRRLAAYLEAVFDGTWGETLDPGNDAAITALLDRLGLEAAAFELRRDALRTEVGALQGRLRAAGLLRVPAYVAGDEVFYGRAHLPMLRWLLTGASGQPPI